ncbi:ethanolamine utilization protein EutN [Geosporobacter subterraneus DSM 17957]|uniref:Ethanolamine utilization protein EutN n=1 Tax=Geosporobacter subterraneus DSM 17957 TaxID=1121919 RepID=A0A1M6LPI5_9FIRM|nr:EutN/CcmL family microcompartment protein [Geosporobacter subterraneus]SHJ73078.1 ethanolamine utilization protein EutN [Geosporobacter subterraneus DSM 17957]
MYLAKIVGNVIATRKDEALIGSKILIVQPINGKYESIGNEEVAIDSVGAGVGEIVIVSKGSSARVVSGKEKSPVDAAIIGIVDSMEVNG